jgi:hypothetical protein
MISHVPGAGASRRGRSSRTRRKNLKYAFFIDAWSECPRMREAPDGVIITEMYR